MKQWIFTFDKVPFHQFVKDCVHISDDEDYLLYVYENIKLPEAKTLESAGFDFHSPFTFDMYENTTIFIPTGIRFRVTEIFVSDPYEHCGRYSNYDAIHRYHLKLYPKSGLGTKFMLQLSNTVGIIDSDYSKSDNFGHIGVSLYRPAKPQSHIVTKYNYKKIDDSEKPEWIVEDGSFRVLPDDSSVDKPDNNILHIEAGQAFVQGIIEPHIPVQEYTRNEVRNGGFGSTR